MTSTRAVLACALLAIPAWTAAPSGPIGIYGIVEKVVLEPNETAAERIQVWGAFAYADLGTAAGTASPIRRGYMYFTLPHASIAPAETIRREWTDLKSVAGTNQAVAFGRWGYIAAFNALDPGLRPSPPSFLYHARPGGGGGDSSDLRVRPATESPTDPAVYQTNTGVVKLPDTGNYADLVKKLRDAIKAR